MCVTPVRSLNLTAASSVNMENSHEESLLSAVEEFSPQPSPNPADFRDSDRIEREEEEPLGFEVRPYMFKLLSTAAVLLSRERESRLISVTCGPARWLRTNSIYMTEGGKGMGWIFKKEFYWMQN